MGKVQKKAVSILSADIISIPSYTDGWSTCR